MDGFKNFIKTQGVVAFAVALAIGQALVEFVSALIGTTVNPIISIILGDEAGLAEASTDAGGTAWPYGAAISTFITFIGTALVVYLLVKMVGADKWDADEE